MWDFKDTFVPLCYVFSNWRSVVTVWYVIAEIRGRDQCLVAWLWLWSINKLSMTNKDAFCSTDHAQKEFLVHFEIEECWGDKKTKFRYWSRRIFFFNLDVFHNFNFWSIYFEKMCPMFVSSVFLHFKDIKTFFKPCYLIIYRHKLT